MARPKAVGKVRPHLDLKRAHRARLEKIALDHWTGTGDMERAAYLAKVRAALVEEGFRSTPFQWRHAGHEFGLIKDLHNGRQIHVRVYDNGIIDAEYEVHKRFVQHLYSPRPSAHRSVQRIFTKHGIPTHLVNEHYLPKVGARRQVYPRRRTKVSHVAGILGGVVAVSVARFVLRRWRGRAD